MKRLFFGYLITLVLTINLYPGPITPLQQSAKNVALGNIGSSFPAGISSIFYNPALLLLNKRNHFTIEYTYNHENQFRNINAGYLHKWSERIATGFNLVYFKPADITVYKDNRLIGKFSRVNHILNAGPAVRINKMLNIGFNFKLINVLQNQQHDNAFNFDIGLLYRPINFTKNLNVGLNVMNLLITKIEIDNETIKEPLNIRAGIGYTVPYKDHKFLFTEEFNSKKEYPPLYAFGFEYLLYNIFSMQLGYSVRPGHNEETGFTGGSGINSQFLSLNYSCEKNQDVINSRISLTYFFKPDLTRKKKEIYYNQGIIYYDELNYKKSYKLFSKLYEEDSKYKKTAYYYKLLQKKLEEQDKKKSEKLQMADGLYRQSLKHFKQQEYPLSIKKLVECLKKNPRHTDAKQLLSKIRRIQLELANKEKARTREKEGDNYFSASDYPAAIVEYEEALELDPENPEIKEKISRARNELKSLDIKTLSLNLYNEGKSLFEQKHYNKAVSKWNEALAANPDFTQIKTDIKNARQKIKENKEKFVMDRIVQDEIDDLFTVANDRINKKACAEALFKVEDILELDPQNQKAKSLKNSIVQKINEEKQENIFRKKSF